MPTFAPGQEIRVPCTLSPGPFSDETIVTFETVRGPVSGFIDADEISEDSHGGKFVKGIVRAIHPDAIEVWIKGSFFTTNGLAAVARERVLSAA